MKAKFFFLVMCVCTCLVSCTNIELDEFPQDELNVQVENCEVSFLYKGDTYSCTYQRTDDDVIFLSEDVSEIVDVLKSKTNLFTYVHHDGSLEYFDSVEEFEEIIDRRFAAIPMVTDDWNPRQMIGGTLTLYEKDNYKGDKWSMSVRENSPIDNVYVGKKWNDRISSFKLISDYVTVEADYPKPKKYCRIEFYQDRDFGGNSIGYVVDGTTVSKWELPQLKKIPLYPGSKENWNDKISSFKFSFN